MERLCASVFRSVHQNGFKLHKINNLNSLKRNKFYDIYNFAYEIENMLKFGENNHVLKNKDFMKYVLFMRNNIDNIEKEFYTFFTYTLKCYNIVKA
jgi:CRISPR/Cas system CSM-associated protein Csm2 small subunit